MAMSRAGRRRLILALVVCAGGVAVAGGYVFRQAQLRSNMARWLEEGTAAHDRGDYEAAIANLNEFVSRDKSNVEALLDFADARRRVPIEPGSSLHLVQAQSLAQSALAIEPDSLRGRRILLDVYETFGMPTETREAAEAVLALASDDIDAHRSLLRVLAGLGRTDEAITEAETMAAAAPDDMVVQMDAFEALMVFDADLDRVEAFLDRTAARFADRLGLEVMRLQYQARQMGSLTVNSPELAEREAEFVDTLRKAAALPAETETEAQRFLALLNRFGQADQELAQLAGDTLARYMQDPALAEAMAAFAAEQAWAQGSPSEAAALLAKAVDSMDTAGDNTLGWLALCGGSQGEAALAELRTRDTSVAQGWVGIVEAAELLHADDGGTALAKLNIMQNLDASLQHVAMFLRGRALSQTREAARAVQVWSELLREDPRWAVARVGLAEAYLNLGRPLDAHDVLHSTGDLRARTLDPLLWLRVELAVDEAGLERTISPTSTSYRTASVLAPQYPDDPEIVSLHARAALANGKLEEARRLVDTLLTLDLAATNGAAVELVLRLEDADPARAQALRTALSNSATDLETVYSLALADLASGQAAEGRARLVQRLSTATDGDRQSWETAIALYDDTSRTEGAADALFELSARYPDSVSVQESVLKAQSVWRHPDRLGPVIDRLREGSGENGTGWRLFDLKRQLAALDVEGADAVERAAEIQIAVAGVIREDPTNVDALLIASDAAEIAGDMNRAADFLQRAALAAPENTSLQLALPDLLLKAGRLSAATRQAESLANLTLRSPSQLRERAEILIRFGRADLARDDWERLAVAGDPIAAVRFAATLAATGQQERADAIIEDVLDDETVADEVRAASAMYFADTDRFDRGLALINTLPEGSEAGGRGRLLGLFLAANMRDMESVRRNESIAAEVNEPEVWASVAQGYLRLGEFDEAGRVVARGLDSFPESEALRTLDLALKSDSAQDPTAMLVQFQTDLVLLETPEAVAVSGLIDQRLREEIDDGALIASLKEMTATSPGLELAWEALVYAEMAAGRYEDAATTLRDAMDAMPQDGTIAHFATNRLYELGRIEDALFAARQWSQRVGGSYSSAVAIAITSADLGRSREAMAAIDPWRETILANRDNAPGDYYLLARVVGMNGDSEAAVAMFEPVVTTSRNWLVTGLKLTQGLQDVSVAKAWLDRLEPAVVEAKDQEVSQEFTSAWWSAAVLSGQDADVRLAIEAMSRQVDLYNGEFPAGRFGLAVCYERLGEYGRAIEHYRALLGSMPQSLGIRNNLAYALLRSGGDTAEALQLAEENVSLARSSGVDANTLRSFMDTLGEALLAAGRPDEAARVYREALEPDPSWPVGILGLAEAQLAAGRPDEARQTLQRLRLSGLSDHLADRARALALELEN